ncbi:MAG: hypothetical protein AAB049_06575, partial [Nitrospirota bacterium]
APDAVLLAARLVGPTERRAAPYTLLRPNIRHGNDLRVHPFQPPRRKKWKGDRPLPSLSPLTLRHTQWAIPIVVALQTLNVPVFSPHHYEQQTEDEAVAEDEAAFENQTQTVMEVPNELVPAIRELIAKHK